MCHYVMPPYATLTAAELTIKLLQLVPGSGRACTHQAVGKPWRVCRGSEPKRIMHNNYTGSQKSIIFCAAHSIVRFPTPPASFPKAEPPQPL